MSGPDLRSGNQSRNQSHIDISETLPKEQEIPPPQDQRKPAQEPKKHTRAPGSRIDGEFPSGRWGRGDAKFISDFPGGPQGGQEREAKNASGDALGGCTKPDSFAT